MAKSTLASSVWRDVYSTSSMPMQTVEDSVKLTSDWQHACMDFMEHRSMRFDLSKNKDLRKYKLLGPDYPFSEFGYVTNPFQYLKKNDDDDEYGNTEEIKHYPIAAQAINTFLGEYIKRPLNFYVISTSPRARNEHLRVKSEMLFKIAVGQIQKRIVGELEQQGMTPENPEFEQQLSQNTPEAVQDYMNKDYCDIVEQLGQKICKNLWLRETLDMEFMYGMRHACVTAKEFYHITSVRNQVKIKGVSPLNVFFQKSPNSHWISESQYAGFHAYKTLSTIVDEYGNRLKVQDVRNLESLVTPGAAANSGAYNANVFATSTGVTFNTMNDLAIDNMLTQYQHTGNSYYYDNAGMIKVIQAYWRSKKEVAELTFVDEEGEMKKMYVDRNYKIDYNAMIDVKWEYLDQIYQGTKIGSDIYLDVMPYEHQYYDPEYPNYSPLPIEGCLYNAVHTDPISIVDLMTPWIELYDIVAHELKKDMRKSIGKVMFMSYDNMPKIKGFSKEKWLYWLREFGIAWVSNNQKNQGQFSHYSAQDMSYAEQMIAKMQILDKIKANCDAFAGFSQPRLSEQGETLGQDRQSIAASVNQTEYWYFKHTKLIEKVLSQAVNLQKRLMKDNKFLRNLFDDLELAYIDYENLDLDNEMLQVFITNSSEALAQKELLRSLGQAAVQNGADLLDTSDILLAETQSEVRNVLEKLREEKKQQEAQAQQLEQQKMQTLDKINQDKINNDNLMLDKKLASQERQMYMRTFAMQENNLVDSNDDQVPDVLQNIDYFTRMSKASNDAYTGANKVINERKKMNNDFKLKQKELDIKNRELDIQLKNQENDLKIATKNAQGRNK